jgi:hypothetical protein
LVCNYAATESQHPVGASALELPVVVTDQLDLVVEVTESQHPVGVSTESELPVAATDELDPVVEVTESQHPVGVTTKRQHSAAESTFIGPFQISPPPKQHHDTRKRESGRRGKTAILTSSPYKQKLVEKREEKKVTEKLVNAKQTKKDAAVGRSKKLSAETSVTRGKKRKNADKKDASPRGGKKKKNSRGTKKELLATVEDEDNEPCLYCNGLYSEWAEPWIQCSSCYLWAHISCAGSDAHDYKCEICTQ